MSDVTAGAVHRLAKLLRELAQAATANPGERPPSASTIAVVEDVAGHPGSSISEIVDRTRLAQSLVSRTVDKLVERGLFLRFADSADGRRTLVQLDPGAPHADLRRRGARTIDAILTQRFPELNPAQRARVVRALGVLTAELLAAEESSTDAATVTRRGAT